MALINRDIIINPANWIIIGSMIAFWLITFSLFNQVTGTQGS